MQHIHDLMSAISDCNNVEEGICMPGTPWCIHIIYALKFTGISLHKGHTTVHV